MIIEDFQKDIKSLVDLYKNLNDNFSEQVKILDYWLTTRQYSEQELIFLKQLIRIEIELEQSNIEEINRQIFQREIDEGLYDEAPPEIPDEVIDEMQKESQEMPDFEDDFPEIAIKIKYKDKFYYRQNPRYQVFQSELEANLSFLIDDINSLTFRNIYPETFDEIDSKFVRLKEHFTRAEKWLFEKNYIDAKGKWENRRARKGEIGAFVFLLAKERIINKGKGYRDYFSERYEVDNIKEQVKEEKASKYYNIFNQQGIRNAIFNHQK